MLNKRELKELAMIRIVYRHGKLTDAQASAKAWVDRAPEARREARGDAVALLIDEGSRVVADRQENAA